MHVVLMYKVIELMCKTEYSFIHDDILGEIVGEIKVKMNNLCDVVFAIKKHLPSNTRKNEMEELQIDPQNSRLGWAV